ncbi:MAG TPA: hypothetical protein VNM72_13065 [Blastocatellia bacterium]|nr:hypothetical protein [Blastocatellia bacterium]
MAITDEFNKFPNIVAEGGEIKTLVDHSEPENAEKLSPFAAVTTWARKIPGIRAGGGDGRSPAMAG